MVRRIRLLGLFLLIIHVVMSPALFAQRTHITKRLMTEDEFGRLKVSEGTYEEGRNYNMIIDGHGTGLKPPTAEGWEEMRRMRLVVDDIDFSTEYAPPNHDNSASDWFPPVGDQDGEGSCVSWACGYYTKTFQEALEHRWDLSDCNWVGGFRGFPDAAYQNQIFSPDFIYHQVNNGQDHGSFYSDNMSLLERVGCCTWEKMPYDPFTSTEWPSEAAWREAPLYRSETAHILMWLESDQSLEDLKQVLADSNLGVISINADYYSSLTSEDLWTVDSYNPSSRNHANTIVGYDDDFGPFSEEGNPDVYGAFKVVNSWGKGSWENVRDGYYYISYECMKRRVQYTYFYENRVGYDPQLIAVFELSHDLRGECQVTMGIGDTGAPDELKRFDDYTYRGGLHPYPSNPMAMDITEFESHMTGPPDSLFLRVYDGGTEDTGVIDFFSVEAYNDYRSGVPVEVYVSPDPPVGTVNGSAVHAYATSAECGDCSGNGRVTVGDATYLVLFLYRDGVAPRGSGDVNLDGRITIADAAYIASFVYRNGTAPCEPSFQE
jgi:hypothetical protein